jgi:purine-cytosine permease-like protein
MEIVIEMLGWVASVLIVGAYALNLRGVLSAKDPRYIWSNIVGGVFFVVNTIHHRAYPSALVNVVWVVIALLTLIQKPKQPVEPHDRP